MKTGKMCLFSQKVSKLWLPESCLVTDLVTDNYYVNQLVNTKVSKVTKKYLLTRERFLYNNTFGTVFWSKVKIQVYLIEVLIRKFLVTGHDKQAHNQYRLML